MMSKAHFPGTHSQTPPRCVATVGLHGSASTWVFNVVRELMCRALGEDRVHAMYTDHAHEIPDAAALMGRHLIVKSHHGSAGLDAWLDSVRPSVFLSIRDPRDAAISMAQRFKSPLNAAVRWLQNDCQRLMRLADRGHPLLRYEDRFFEDPKVVSQLSAAITPTLGTSALLEVFERYRSESVRRFAADLGSLPAERLIVSDRMLFDKVTHVHRGHIGNTHSGKWLHLQPETRATMSELFMTFLQRFAYELPPP